MKNHSFAKFLCLSITCMYGFMMVGCDEPKTTPNPEATTHDDGHNDDGHDHNDDGHDHDDDGHDHEDDHDHDADAHDHPAHGIRGGHLIELSGDKDVEVQFADDKDMFTVFVADAVKPDTVTKVAMTTDIAGKMSDYTFEKTETPDGLVYRITDPLLSTAVKMGDVVKTTLVITTAEGELTGVYKHHAH